MRHTYIPCLFVLFTSLFGIQKEVHSQTIFNYTGSVQSYTVPTGVTSLILEAWGAQGATATDKSPSTGTGGLGSYAKGTLTVTPGQVLSVYVGGAGLASGTGGFNGGGNGGSATAGTSCSGGFAGGGGGASDVRALGILLTNRVIVAGGGGGAGRDYCNGPSCLPCGCGGSGGAGDVDGVAAGSCGFGGAGSGINNGKKGALVSTVNAGSGDGGGTNGTSGVSGIGGNGAAGIGDISGGGGGGGFYGGGGGGGAVNLSTVGGGGGGGGSSYVGGVTSTTTTNNVNALNGLVVITPVCLAGTITGTNNTCAGSSTALTNATTGGAWSSSNTVVATVTSVGLVSGLTAGTITITYKQLSGCQSVYAVTVNPVPGTILGTAVVCAGLNTGLSSATLGGTWTSGTTSLATVVSGTGVVSGVAAGTPTITYKITATGCLTTKMVTVNPVPTAILGTASVCAGLSTGLSSLTSGGTWSSGTTTLATIGSSNGIVNGVAAGTPTITYKLTATGCQITRIATVNPLPGTVLGTAVVCAGLNTGLSNLTTGGTWTSGNTTLATVVSGSGVVSGLVAGTPTITYTITSTGCLTTQVVTVNPVPTSILGTASVCAGLSTGLSSITAGGTWSSGTTTLATIGSANGIVNGVAAGTPTITYKLTATGCQITRIATVNPLPGTVLGTAVVCAGLTTGLSNLTTGGTWTSGNTTLATVVSGSGVVSGLVAGTPTITYTITSTGCLTTQVVTVNPVPSAILGTASVCAGLSTGLSSATSGGTWSSGTTTLATIGSSNGIVNGVAAGTPTITYKLTATGCQITRIATVNPLPGAILGAGTVCAGLTTGFSDLTTGGTWSSGNTTLATIGSSTGAVAGVATGTPTITYALTTTGCQITRVLTVNPLPAPITGTTNVCAGLTTQLTTAATGGTWSSSATAKATIGSGTGLALGVASGTSTITYKITATTCQITTSLTVNPLPTNILGTATVCAGLTTGLSDVATGGTWTSSTSSVATIGSGTGTVNGIAAGTSTITYQLNTGCQITRVVTVYPLPTAINGTANVCVTYTTGLSCSTSGGKWTSSATGLATIVSGTGVVTGMAPGTPTITYTITATGCISTRLATVNPLPASITGTSVVCVGLTTPLTTATSGGNWSSSNTGLATVAGGVVTGVVAGTPDISYQLPTGCFVTNPVTVNPLPAPITGPAAVCKDLSVTWTEPTTGGTWSIASTSIATLTVSSSTTASITGVSAGTTTVTYTLPTGCIMSRVILVNPLPVPITAPPGSCVTDALNPVITLVNASGTGSWSSSNTTVATIVSFSGDLTSIMPGTTIITYTLPTGCIATTIMTINPPPAMITGTKIVCANADMYLYNTSIGGTWASSNPTLAVVGSGTGIVTGVSGYSTPTISYTLPTGCLGITTVTVNPAPGSVSGTTDVCVGSFTTLVVGGGGTWASSNPGFATVTAGPGTGGGVVTGIVAGSPLITYTLPVTGCFNTTTITVNPVPSPITGIPQVCYGFTTTLNSSTTGGTWSSSLTTLATVSGTGVVTAVDPAGGTTDISYSLGTGCAAVQTVTVNTLPIPYTLNIPTGISNYCAGGTGVDIQLNVSTYGVDYQLYNGITPVGSPVGGTGGTLDFGNQTAGGAYTAVATDALTGCVSNMTGSPVINIDPLPFIYTLSYSGPSSNYCDKPGAAGVDICLNNTQSGIYYTLYINGAPGPVMVGTGSAMCFGPQTATGIYTAIAQDPVTFCESNMSGSVTVGKDPLPDLHNVTVTNAGNYCLGSTGVNIGVDYANTGIRYDLYKGGTSVTAKPGANSSLDFGVFTAAGVYTVVATNAITGCTQNMSGSATVTILPLPHPHSVNVIGSSSYCVGGTGVHVELGGSDLGTNYQLYNGITKTGVLKSGTGSTIDYGFLTTGTYTVLAVDAGTGCTATMPGSASVTIFPALNTYTVTVSGSGKYCAGDPGLHVNLNGSSTGVRYDLYYNGGSVPLVTKPGTGSAIDFGVFSGAGVYSVLAVNTTSFCTALMKGNPTITINVLPAAYNVMVTNGGNLCAGSAGVNISLSFSDVGVSYQLYRGLTPVGAAKAGSNASLDFGIFTTGGTYTIVGTNTVTTCNKTMNGSAVVTVNPMPVAYAITGGGSYCAGSVIGVAIGLSKSDAGINYQLFNGLAPVGAAVGGTGGPLSFGSHTAIGLYTVTATDAATGCSVGMPGSKVITIDPLPAVYNVTGGGTACAGGPGFRIGVSNSSAGVDYKLLNGTVVVKTVTGTSGMPIDFGLQAVSGTYTVEAKTTISGCTVMMNGSAVINMNPVPTAYNLKGGGSYCAGDTGSVMYLAGSEAGVMYQLQMGSTPVGSPVAGTGMKLDFAPQTKAGAYTAIGYYIASGCPQSMSGSVTVSINPVPVAYTVTGGGTMCAGDTGYHIFLSGSEKTVSYQLYKTGSGIGASIAGTGMALDFGLHGLAGSYTIAAVNVTTGCASKMVAGGTINVNPAPASFTITGSGNYCAGSTGFAVGLPGSESGINYQLYDGVTIIGTPVGGTGTGLLFGIMPAGVYTIKATNTATKCSATMTGTATIIEDTLVVPSVKITGTDGIACIGDVTNYTAVPVNGGTAPTYVWKVRGLPMGKGSTFGYIPASGETVTVEMSGNAKCSSVPMVSDAVVMSTLPYIMASATVAPDPSVDVCKGTPVSFSAATTDGGDAPAYSWLKNGVLAGSGTSFNYTPDDGDIIVFRLLSSYRCRMSDTVFSDPLVMTVDEAIPPTFTIDAHLGPVIVGQVDTFIVHFINKPAKGTLTYQWYVKGTQVPGANQPVYINHDVYDKDEISCEVTRVGACGGQSATSKTTVTLRNLAAHQLTTTKSTVSILPNPNKGEFTVKGQTSMTDATEVTLEISNIVGQVVYSGKVAIRDGVINEHIKLSNTIANGMYILNLRTPSGNDVYHIVIEQ